MTKNNQRKESASKGVVHLVRFKTGSCVPEKQEKDETGKTLPSKNKHPRILKKDSRVFTIAYRIYDEPIDSQGNNVQFGASVFHMCTFGEHYERKAHSHTAVERMKKRPLLLKFDKKRDDEDYWKELYKFLYKTVRTQGTGAATRLSKNDLERFENLNLERVESITKKQNGKQK